MPVKQNKRVLLIVDGISFYTDTAQVTCGVGDSTRVNEVCRTALKCLETLEGDGATGLTGSWLCLNVQIQYAP